VRKSEAFRLEARHGVVMSALSQTGSSPVVLVARQGAARSMNGFRHSRRASAP
jgi:hypothetical protein